MGSNGEGSEHTNRNKETGLVGPFLSDEDGEMENMQPEDAVEIIEIDPHASPPGESDSDISDQDEFADSDKLLAALNDSGAENGEFAESSAEKVEDAAYVLREHTQAVFTVCSSSQGRNLLASGSGDDTGIIFDLDNGTVLSRVDGFKESVTVAQFSPDGRYCALGALNGTLAVVSLEEAGPSKIEFDELGDAVEFLAWHPSGPVFIAGSADNTCKMCNARISKTMIYFIGHGNTVTCGGFSADGNLVITGSADGSVRTWAPKDGRCLATIASGSGRDFHSGEVLCLATGEGEANSKVVLTGGMNGGVRLTNFESGKIIAALPDHDGSVESVAFSGASLFPMMAASAGTDGKIQIWDLEASALRFTLTHDAAVTKIRWHPSSHQILSGSVDGTVRLWDTRTSEEIRRFVGHTDGVLDVCFAKDQTVAASASDDGTVRLYDIRLL